MAQFQRYFRLCQHREVVFDINACEGSANNGPVKVFRFKYPYLSSKPINTLYAHAVEIGRILF